MEKKVKIKKIEEVQNTSLLYDIEVKDNNNFYANGILVHNCQSATFTGKILPRFNTWFGIKMFNIIQKWK